MKALEVISTIIAGAAVLSCAIFIGESMTKYEDNNLKRIKAEKSCLYKAWVKETGNLKDLTEDEFIVLYVNRSSWDGRYIIESKVKSDVK